MNTSFYSFGVCIKPHCIILILPYSGVLMGAMQLPVALAVRDSLGGSSSYCTLISQSRRLSQVMPYFTSFQGGGVSSWWQVNTELEYEQ